MCLFSLSENSSSLSFYSCIQKSIKANSIACPFFALSTSSHEITPQFPPDRSVGERRPPPDTQRYSETPVDFLTMMGSARITLARLLTHVP